MTEQFKNIDVLNQDGIKYNIKEIINIDDHQIAWAKIEDEKCPKDKTYDIYYLICSCLTNEKQNHSINHYTCKYLKAATYLQQLKCKEKIKEKYSQNIYQFYDEKQISEIILYLLEETKKGQWIGQTAHYSHTDIFIKTIAEILEMSPSTIDKICLQMFKEQKIGLTGNIICPWTKDFLPEEDDDSNLDDNIKPEGQEINVELFFYSETGTEGGYWATQEKTKENYEGLHILGTGDWLEIENGFKGYIRLKHFPLFTESAGGFWIHSEQKNFEREKWAKPFFEGTKAKLIKRIKNEN